jgi:hypothetical protein
LTKNFHLPIIRVDWKHGTSGGALTWGLIRVAKPKKKDNHKSGFLVRLPEAYRGLLQLLKQKTDRPITASVRRGVDKELKENGIEPPAKEE